MNKSFTQQITEKAKARLMSLLDEKPPEEKKPTNIGLVVAWLGFNFVFLFLDIGTSALVWTLTNGFYALMVFVAGITPFTINEILFVRAWNSQNQKWMAIIGAATSVLFTVLLALIVGTINAIRFFEITTMAAWIQPALEWSLIIGMVLGVAIHGLIWTVYFFTDPGILARQIQTSNRASRAKRHDDFEMAKGDVLETIKLVDEIEQAENNNLLEALNKMFERYSGHALQPMNTNAVTVQQPKNQQLQRAENNNGNTDPTQAGKS